ncbi:PREDICTED: uncharacterized protein LOC104811040 [Tarenaya hassleriana]|uniref:uncharacterized protein LOC104811040 n=1 Tax=Tarenaya hassleriana TaxID=28532 RepID=UPI00053C0876|nr:PREDICTED: uncharacterized protein LOC104811040 [Tarenaya hassleriana]
MQRIQSGCRPSDEFLVNLSPESSVDLTAYDVTKKENAVLSKSVGERAVHLIPLVLFLCAFILWAFSYTSSM